MKFCKNLQRVVEISDPEWAPYWINYKHLKKLIKGIVSSTASALPPGDTSNRGDVASGRPESARRGISVTISTDSQAESSMAATHPNAQAVAAGAAAAAPIVEHQSQGDETSERRQAVGQQSEDPSVGQHPNQVPRQADSVMLDQIGKSPGERAFFKLLHSEVKKSTHFFDQAQREYAIREERVRKGLEIIKNEQNDMSDADERWSRCAQSIFRLYRELLLLETFAIMTYCGFSKILKKHDKNTGFSTKNAFMAKIVNQANFVTYPRLLQMINRCEQLYEEVSTRLMEEGKDDLHEDQRLFIHMVQRLNSQVVGGGSTEEESSAKAPRVAKTQATNPSASPELQLPSRSSPLSQQEAWKAQSLKELVAENDTDASTARTNDDSDSDSDAEEAKPKASRGGAASKGSRKRPPSEDDDNPSSKVAKRRQS